jgi:hypothetical protein
VRLRLEPLEDRTLLSVLVINDTTNPNPATWLVTASSVTETVQDQPPITQQTSDFTGVVINAGTGGNTFDVQSIAAGVPLTINSQAVDTVNLGNPTHGVRDILADVTLTNPSQATTLFADDSTDTIGRSVSITSAGITGLAPGNINIPSGPCRAVTILGGSGGNLFNVQGTAAGATTTLVAQLGDTANVGQNGSVQGILGDLNLDPNCDSCRWGAILVDDSVDPTPRAVTITGTSITGLSPAVINYDHAANLTVDGGAGGNNYTVDMATLPPSVTLKDTTGTDQVTILAPPGNNVMTLTATSLSATVGAGFGKIIIFDLGATITSFTINGGGTNQVVLVGNPPGPLTLVQVAPYSFSGFLPPLNQNLSFAAGRTVPIKFQLTDLNGNFISSLSDVTSLAVIYPDGTTHAISGLRYDSTDNQFIANWSTKGLAAGAYTISLSLLDGTTHAVTVQLATAHSSAGMTTAAAGGTSAAPGGLLGGDIDLYVDNTNSNLTADELARVQNAVTAVDAVTEPYGVAVTEVTDPSQADVTLNMNSTSAVGGYADGVLGCTTDAGQITIIAGWNYYAGSDATQISSSQFDFQTVVTHELGHALGLGHSSDSTSVMFATLNTGMVDRSLTSADLNVVDSDTTGACGLHAATTPTQNVDFFSASAPVLGMPSGVPERAQASVSADSRQAGLNAVLVDWPSASDFSEKSAHLLNDAHSHLSRLSQPTIDDQDAFWSSAAGATVLDRITDLSGHLGS